MRVVEGQKRVVTEPEYAVETTTLRRTLQTRETDNQELCPSDDC
jgi:hypothetical protein